MKNCDSLVHYKLRWTVVTNCDSFFITKCDPVYYQSRQVLQCDGFIITSCDRYYNAMDLLQIATGFTKCDDYYKLRQYNISIRGTLALVPRVSPEQKVNHYREKRNPQSQYFQTLENVGDVELSSISHQLSLIVILFVCRMSSGIQTH